MDAPQAISNSTTSDYLSSSFYLNFTTDTPNSRSIRCAVVGWTRVTNAQYRMTAVARTNAARTLLFGIFWSFDYE